MKRKTKMIISALSVMLVMVLAVTIVSFSLAGNNGDGDNAESSDEQLLYAMGDDQNTNIDNIIENSHLEETEADDGSAVDPYYRIVEIGSGSASALQTMCNGDVNDFMQYVINGNKSAHIDVDMKDKTLLYSYYDASTVMKDSAELAAIARADFIYVSCDPNEQYSVTNDLGEDLYNFLKNTYLTQKKPLIIDSPEKTKELGGEGDEKEPTMTELATKVFATKGSRYYTNSWDRTISAYDYVRHQNGSLYLGINGDRRSSKWIGIVDGADRKYMAKTLIISASADDTVNLTNNAMANDLFTYAENGFTAPVSVSGGKTDEAGITYETVYDLKKDASGSDVTTLLARYGYNNRYTVPDYMCVEEASLADIDADMGAYDFSAYDIIIIENDVASSNISTDLYKKFSSAMIGNVTIIYDKTMISTSTGGGTTGGGDIDMRSTNYRELFYTVANTKDVSLRTNVMVTNRQELESIATSKSAETCKVIADLINASSFRGIGGGGAGSSDIYTVLEIQPCYPVDETVAKENVTKRGKTARRFSQGVDDATGGFYYTIPYDVVNNKASEQLDDGTEYYNWELSVAKIADATGIDPNKIKIVHMSTDEFAASKQEVLGTYDLVYIGADNSALKQNVLDYEGFAQILQGNYNIMSNISSRVTNINTLPIYTVFSHNGDIATLALDQMGESGAASVRTGDHIVGEQFSNSSKTFVRLNGNDITYNGRVALEEYLTAGMPVVVSKELADMYDGIAAQTNEYQQNLIDPDCNVYKFLTTCKTAGTDNVLWGFDSNATVDIAPEAGFESLTIKGYVNVFADTNGRESISQMDTDGTPLVVKGDKDKLKKLVDNSKSRLMVSLTNSDSVIYNMYDENTKFKKSKADKIVYKLNVASFFNNSSDGCKFNFYIDDNGNSKFEDDEKHNGDISATKITSGSYEVAYTIPASFFGPFYWKIEVIDSAGVSSNITGLSYVANETDEKQTIHVLQVMPAKSVEGAQGAASLYFCTVCQQAYRRLDYNPYCNAGDRYSYNSYYAGNFGTAGLLDASTGKVAQRDVVEWQYWPVQQIVYEAHYGVYMGHHEHTFGIVQYDSGLKVFDKTENGQQLYGMDNWDVNLADEVSDLYDFDLDILYADEMQEISDYVRDAYNVSAAEQKANVLGFKMSASDDEEDLSTFLSIVDCRGASIPEGAVPVYRVKELAAADLVTVSQETVDGAVQYFVNVNYDKLTDAQKKAISDLYISRDYAERANEQWQLYMKESELSPVDADGNRADGAVLTVADTEKDLRGCIEYIIANVGTLGNFGSYSREQTIAEFQRLLDTGYYYDYYNMSNNAARYNRQYNSLGAGKNYEDYYVKYVEAKDREYEYLQNYKKYSRIAAGTDWVSACYDTVVIGAAEEFGGGDVTGTALDDLESFVVNDGTTLLFHDTLSKYTDVHAKNLTARLRDDFGMDRNGGITVQPTQGNYFTDYNAAGDDKYFTTKLPSYDEMKNAITGFDGMQSYYSNVAFTDGVMGSSKSINKAFPYRYADISWSTAAYYGNSASTDLRKTEQFGTDGATQNNKGIVTIFPFTLDEHLNISPTHPQAYALDVENDNMTVWYSMSAGTNTKDGGSSLFAASPNDGMDNYFIYSYGNVSYCGAGHSKVTGVGRDNNDERRLYINIICNSVRKSINQPAIYVYDYQKDTTGDKVKEDGSNYIIKVDTTSEYPEFSFKAITDQTTKLQSVRIYYDLDFSETNTTSAYADNENHVLIGEWKSPDVKGGERFDVGRYIAGLLPLANADGTVAVDTIGTDANGNPVRRQATRLKLLPKYFDPYNGEYTYIVIEAKDTKGNIVYQRIKIKLKDYLFNLT